MYGGCVGMVNGSKLRSTQTWSSEFELKHIISCNQWLKPELQAVSQLLLVAWVSVMQQTSLTKPNRTHPALGLWSGLKVLNISRRYVFQDPSFLRRWGLTSTKLLTASSAVRNHCNCLWTHLNSRHKCTSSSRTSEERLFWEQRSVAGALRRCFLVSQLLHLRELMKTSKTL